MISNTLMIINIWVRRRNIPAFILLVSASMVASETIVAICLTNLSGSFSRENIDVSGHPMAAIMAGIFLAPILETAVAQLFPFKILTILGVRSKIVIYFSMIAVFAAVHIGAGLASTIVAGLVGGAFLAFTFLRWSEVSLKTAFWSTACCHFLVNGVAISMLLAA